LRNAPSSTITPVTRYRIRRLIQKKSRAAKLLLRFIHDRILHPVFHLRNVSPADLLHTSTWLKLADLPFPAVYRQETYKRVKQGKRFLRMFRGILACVKLRSCSYLTYGLMIEGHPEPLNPMSEALAASKVLVS
jgi:hypothetical protein